MAIALGDVNADGALDLVTLDTTGTIRRESMGAGGWTEDVLASWPESGSGISPGAARLLLADLDNNGAVDVLASSPAGTGIWLAGEDYAFTRFAGEIEQPRFDFRQRRDHHVARRSAGCARATASSVSCAVCHGG